MNTFQLNLTPFLVTVKMDKTLKTLDNLKMESKQTLAHTHTHLCLVYIMEHFLEIQQLSSGVVRICSVFLNHFTVFSVI